jgi:hypothetical protein
MSHERPSSAPGSTLDPSFIDETLDSRATTSENPTGARGAGGRYGGGRKGRGGQAILPGESAVLADIEGTGTIRHFWIAAPGWGDPRAARSLRLEAG